MGGKGGSKGPNVTEAARIEGEHAREAARDVTYADRPDQYNPFGSITWGQEQVIDPATGEPVTKWVQHQNMSPDLQNLYGSWMSGLAGQSGLASGMMGRIEQEMGAAPDWAQFGDVQGLEYNPAELRSAAEDAAYQRETMRLDPQYQKRERDMEIKLRNQGLAPGDQAYDAAMSTLGQERADAYERARLGATQTGMAEAQQMYQQQMGSNERANALRQQQIEEYLGKRGFSLGESRMLDPTEQIGNISDIFTGG